jgi:hypothetical protein
LFDLKSDRSDRQRLAVLGDVRTPSISDLFVALLGDKSGNKAGEAQEAQEGRVAR